MQAASDNALSAAYLCVDRIDSAVEASRRLSYDNSIRAVYAAYERTGDYLELYDMADSLLSRIYRFDDKFRFADIHFAGGVENGIYLRPMEIYALNESLFPRAGQYTAMSAYIEFRNNDLEPISEKAKDLGTSIAFLKKGGQMYLIRNIFLSGSLPSAVLILQLNTANWFDSLESVPWSKNIAITINDQTIQLRGDEEMPSSASASLNSSIGAPSQNSAEYVEGKIYQADYVFYYRVEVDNSVLLKDVRRAQFMILLTMPLVLPFLIYLIRFYTRDISSEVQFLIDGSEKIKQGNFGLQVENRASSSEFNRLTDSFNAMSAQLKSQIEKIHLEESDLHEAKIKALQSQINPHFLGNTLEIINWEARLGNNAKVSRMIEALSTMLDAAIGRTGPTIRLSQEMMYVDAYLYIIGERYGKRLTVVKEIDKELLDYHVPRLILQPVIENAVEHGIAPFQQGTLIIRIYKDENTMFLEIENTGEFSEEDEKRVAGILRHEEAPEGSVRLGIRNTDERLKILHGPESALTITRTGGAESRTLSRIVIPLSKLDLF